MTAGGFLETLFSLSLQAALLIAITRWLTRRPQAEPVADRLWLSCHVALLALTTLGIAIPHVRLLPHAFITSHFHQPGIERLEFIAGSTLFWVWLCGLLLSLIALAGSTFKMAIFLRKSSPLATDRCAALEEVATGVEPVHLLTSREAVGPFCWQIHRPAIVLPEFVLELPDDELQMIIRHEAAHLRAAHPLHLFLQRLVEAIYWFHPLVWRASYLAACSREFRCDSEAVRDRDATPYLRSLLRLAEHTTQHPPTLTAGLPFGGNKNLVQQRAARLAQTRSLPSVSRTATVTPWSALIAATCLIATLIWVPIDASASDRTLWSPWPTWSASALHAVGIPARDYEVDGHRIRLHE